jgi:hypothetical protein
MAVDGVAPRAKMNQQRSRRFRTAQEAKELEEKARRKGEETPETAAFDSNCITPGTPFMTRLSRHLQYFVNKKIQEDAEWRGVEVILSGHDVRCRAFLSICLLVLQLTLAPVLVCIGAGRGRAQNSRIHPIEQGSTELVGSFTDCP